MILGRAPGPNSAQFEAIKGYLKSGGSAAFLLGEGGEERLGTNVNYLLEEYGMTVHKDSVVSDVVARRQRADRREPYVQQFVDDRLRAGSFLR